MKITPAQDKDKLIAGLQHHVRRLTKLLDDQLGTPCEQVRHAQEIDATIERCAQRLDEFKYRREFTLDELVAAIRALKDK